MVLRPAAVMTVSQAPLLASLEPMAKIDAFAAAPGSGFGGAAPAGGHDRLVLGVFQSHPVKAVRDLRV